MAPRGRLRKSVEMETGDNWPRSETCYSDERLNVTMALDFFMRNESLWLATWEHSQMDRDTVRNLQQGGRH